MEYLAILISFIFINNYVLVKFYGICPFIGVSKDVESALGMGAAVTFVMTLATAVTWMIYNLILAPLNAGYLKIIAFILVIAALVQLVEIIVQKFSPSLYKALGIYLPLITTNCAVLGITMDAIIIQNYGLFKSIFAGFSAGLGFTLVLILMSTLRMKLNFEKVPKYFRGVPIAFITGGLMAMAFMAFAPTIIFKLFPNL
ncbi:MAG: RnfABCDGE type electron transport complex subunit A [Spirochaetales bacterium]|nr:RnfABCDGE type electron transport complex subunit A [Spirochaetales bacterium]